MKKLGILIVFMAVGFVGCKNVETKPLDVDENLITAENPTTDAHTTQISLDWSGVYEGTTPCADCKGIHTIIELKEDESFVANYTYLGKPEGDSQVNEAGSFTWDKDGYITLTPVKGEVSRYEVSENRIVLLNSDNEVNTGELDEMYILEKKMD